MFNGHRLVGLVGLALSLSACSGSSVHSSATTDPSAAPALPPPPQTQQLRVIGRATPRYRRVPRYEARIGELIDSASDHLALRFGLSLDLVAIEPWDEAPAERSLERTLAALEEGTSTLTSSSSAPKPVSRAASRVADERSDVVIAFVAGAPPHRATLRDFSLSRYGGRHIVLRSLTPMFAPEAHEALHKAEVALLLNALGRVFGAIPTCPGTIMAEANLSPQSAHRELATRGWGPLNLALIRLHASMDLTAQIHGGPRIPRDIARRALDQLASPGSDATECAPQHLERRRQVLRAVVDGPAADPSVRPKIEPPPAPGPSEPSAPTPEQRADIERGVRALAQGDAQSAYQQCAPIATLHPTSQASRCAGFAAEATGQPDNAVRFLRAYLSARPSDAKAVLHLARLLGRTGDDAAARALLQGHVGANPDHHKARLNLGIAYARTGDYAAARAQWEEVLRRNPADEDARQLLNGLPPD